MSEREKLIYRVGRAVGLSIMAVALWPSLGWWAAAFMFGFIVFVATASVETRSEALHEMKGQAR